LALSSTVCACTNIVIIDCRKLKITVLGWPSTAIRRFLIEDILSSYLTGAEVEEIVELYLFFPSGPSGLFQDELYLYLNIFI
jgi:hypothetical protein